MKVPVVATNSNVSPNRFIALLLMCVWGVTIGCNTGDKPTPVSDLNDKDDGVPSQTLDQPPESEKIELFDGESIEGWEITNFGTERDCYADQGNLVIDAGIPVSGVTTTRTDLPTMNYEIAFEAKRLEGIDFFVGLTFPVDES